MPDFKKAPPAAKGPGKGRNGKGATPKIPKASTAITEPRCSVCTHASRKVIDRFLARGVEYRELERVFGIDRRSISNHDKKHLNIDDAAVRKIIREQAEDGAEALEEGIKGVLKRKVFLETVLDKAMSDLLAGDMQIEARDVVAIIDKLDAMDSKTSEAQIVQMKIEFFAIMTAVKEIVPQEMWDRISERARQEALRQNATIKSLEESN